MGLTDHQRDFQKLAADFAKNELAPEMMKWDQEVIVDNYFYKFWVLMYTSAIYCYAVYFNMVRVQSTHALLSPPYNRHPDNMDSS